MANNDFSTPVAWLNMTHEIPSDFMNKTTYVDISESISAYAKVIFCELNNIFTSTSRSFCPPSTPKQ